MRALLYATTVMIAIVGARVASADDKADARQHVASATAFHKDGKFAEALVELEAAYALDPKPQLLFAMGQLHARLGHCKDAVEFYNRFLATHPAAGPATIATEAIAACKVDPEPAITEHVTPVKIDVALPPAPAAAPIVVHRVRPWYRDHLADALVAGGLVSGVAAAVVYRQARVDRDRADVASSYDQYASQIDHAHAERTYAIVLGAASVGLIVGGGLHYLLADRGHTEVQIAPEHGGGTVSFGGRF